MDVAVAIISLEYLKKIGYNIVVTRHYYCVEYNGLVFKEWPFRYKRSLGVRKDLAHNREKAHEYAGKLFVEENKKSALEWIEEHGNLVLWGNNLTAIMIMYEKLKDEYLIDYYGYEKVWRKTKRNLWEINLNEQ